MCDPSTSASARTITLWYRIFSDVEILARPAPIAEISAWISVLLSILSTRDFSTFRIFPRIGRIAWV